MMERRVGLHLGLAFEIGHFKPPIRSDQLYACSCGGNGCLEAVASGWALAREAAKLKKNCDPESVFGKAAAVVEKPDAKLLIDAARAGDEAALLVVKDAFKIFAAALANCLILFDVQEVAIGGGIGKNAWDILKSVLDETIPQYVPAIFADHVQMLNLHSAVMNGWETLLGAARFVCENEK